MLPELTELDYVTGGPHTVVKKLYNSEELKENIDFYLSLKKEENLVHIDSRKKSIIGILKKTNLGLILSLMINILKTYFKLKEKTKNYDYIVSHYYIDSFVLSRFFKKKKLINIQHTQGSCYFEFTDLKGYDKGILLKIFMNYLERSIYKSALILGFPSYGAQEAVFKTHPKLESLSIDKEVRILYNGIPLDGSGLKSVDDIKKKGSIIKIITVASINKAKGVDLIPQYIDLLNKNNVDFHWTIIGNGPMSGILEREINKFKLSDKITWIKNRVNHEVIIDYFRQSDYYICLHRYSIFDFSTLEAMYNGCIPILSNVGGNKEVVKWNNGILIDDNINFYDEFCKVNIDIEIFKKLNKNIVVSNFSEEKFNNYYIDLIKELNSI